MKISLSCVLIVIVFVVVATIFLSNRNGGERFESHSPTTATAAATPAKAATSIYSNIIGGTTTDYINYHGHSGILKKLLGNNGKTIILLHNAPLDHNIWAPLFTYTQSLKQKGEKIPTLISYDLLGHGTAWVPVSDGGGDNNKFNTADMQSYAWDIDVFVDDLNTIVQYGTEQGLITNNKFSLVGFGFGGAVALQYALQHAANIDKLYLLQFPVGLNIPATPEEIRYMVNRIATTNKYITYLTHDDAFVQNILCQWFEINDSSLCPYPANRLDKRNDTASVEYLIARKLMRESSVTTTLQIIKLLASLNFVDELQRAKTLPFPIVQLIMTQQTASTAAKVRDEFKLISRVTPSQQSRLLFVDSKHGFVISNPAYISELINGKNMTTHPLTVEYL